LELPDPDSTPAWRRCQMRKDAQAAKFDPEHYIADYMMAEDLEHALAYVPQTLDGRPWTPAEQDTLVQLPRREYLPDADATAAADLAGLLFASCYDQRCSAGERNCESAWTISRVCPSLSSLDSMTDPESAIRAAYARSLAYPLYRNTRVSDAVLLDLKRLVQADPETLRARLLRTLVDVKHVFEATTMLRIFSDIFLTDYCIWIQHVPEAALVVLAKQIQASAVPHDWLPWDIHRLERYAEQVASGDVPDDDEPIWRWPEELEREDTEGGAHHDEIKSGESNRHVQSDYPKREVRISAVAQPGSSDSEDFGIRPVSTRLIAKPSSAKTVDLLNSPPVAESELDNSSGDSSAESSSDSESESILSEALVSSVEFRSRARIEATGSTLVQNAHASKA
jgi:SHQ1 protein